MKEDAENNTSLLKQIAVMSGIIIVLILVFSVVIAMFASADSHAEFNKFAQEWCKTEYQDLESIAIDNPVFSGVYLSYSSFNSETECCARTAAPKNVCYELSTEQYKELITEYNEETEK